VEEIITRVRAEEKDSKPRPDMPQSHLLNQEKEIL